jgi:hypothetical protein
MKHFSIKGYKEPITTLISILLIGHLVYKYVTGELDLLSFSSSIQSVGEVALAIVAYFFKPEKTKKEASFTPNNKKP